MHQHHARMAIILRPKAAELLTDSGHKFPSGTLFPLRFLEKVVPDKICALEGHKYLQDFCAQKPDFRALLQDFYAP